MKSTRLTGVLFLLVTTTGWALNWPAMKVLLRKWPPLFSRGVAGVTTSVLLGIVAFISSERLRISRALMPRMMIAASTNVFAWMGFSTLSMKWLSVSEGALLVYTIPIWSTLLAWSVLGRKPSAKGFLSLLLGLAGVIVLLGSQGFAFDAGKLAGILFALLAAVLFALGTVTTRTPIPVPPISLVAWQVGIGCLPMIVLGLLIEHPSVATLKFDGWAVLIYMTLVPMDVYLARFATLRHLPPEIASIGMLLVPIMGIVAAAFALGEPLGSREFAAMALTLSGVALALRSKRTAPPVGD
ncbi:MAG: Permease of the drug/metabolite transporter (DMT) superfamily [uncultured Paraburkholderia sp.]|nr:MAG: Permease of the drug/metabolite transporter (DMT) superfamily [uncultured Paraburkholderia sp.]CAH2938770.1 MAG: Permease of the drug/metabolite transporter (DMT) superfamily [uncultured Paraburkholderia sp.]